MVVAVPLLLPLLLLLLLLLLRPLLLPLLLLLLLLWVLRCLASTAPESGSTSQLRCWRRHTPAL
jgi:hypothetical protein